MDPNNNITKTNKTKNMTSKYQSIPDKFDLNQTALYPNGTCIHCDVCDIPVKLRTNRPFTLSRWNENIVSKDHQANHDYKTHLLTTKLKSRKNIRLPNSKKAVL